MTAPLAIGDDFGAFARALHVDLYLWQAEAFGQATAREAGRFRYRLAAISVPRGNGKSYAVALVALWRLFLGPPPQDVLSAALDFEGAKVVQDHAKAILRANPDLERQVEVQASSISVPSTGSRWTITSREHTASRGRHPTLICYDEVGWAQDDELFASLLAAQASVEDPQMLVTSTVGRRQSGPLASVKTLAEGGDPGVFWWHSSENLSPRVTPEFLERQRRILLPGQFAREHQNAWVDGADAFTGAAEVDAAMGAGWTERLEGAKGQSYVGFVDLGTVHDPTVIGVGHRDDHDGRIYVDRLLTYQGSREEPVQIATVEAAILELAGRFDLLRIRVESWQGLAVVQSLERLGLRVELYTPTAKSNAEEWPVLAQRLSARTLVLPPHARLREELLNLVYEVGPQGARVIDRGKVHQDHAVAVRGIVAALSIGRDPDDLGFSIGDWNGSRRQLLAMDFGEGHVQQERERQAQADRAVVAADAARRRAMDKSAWWYEGSETRVLRELGHSMQDNAEEEATE